jgi:lipopolysaccharide export system protein LptA
MPRKSLGRTAGQTIVIKSDSLEIDNQKRLVTFTGNVDARADDLIITWKTVRALHGSMQRTSSQKDIMKMDRRGQGSVKITRPDGGLATAEEAVYFQKDNDGPDRHASGKAGRRFCGGVQNNPF